LGKYAKISEMVQKLSEGDCIDIEMDFGRGKARVKRAAIVVTAPGLDKKSLHFAPGTGGCAALGKTPAATITVKSGIYRFLVERSPQWGEEDVF